jgi:F-type H+-transporting ATPase subunit alpha
MVEVLKQGPFAPVAAEKQVLAIFAGNEGYLDDIAASSVVKFEAELIPFIEAKYPDILESIQSKSKIEPDVAEKMKKAIEEFKATFSE